LLDFYSSSYFEVHSSYQVEEDHSKDKEWGNSKTGEETTLSEPYVHNQHLALPDIIHERLGCQ
jgi:hypothetical protein